MESKEIFSHQEDVRDTPPAADNVTCIPDPTEVVFNYQGITVQYILAYLSILLMAFAQMMLVVAPAAFLRDVTLAVGGAEKATWLAQLGVISTCALGPPISQAADYWGRKWFLVVSAVCGFSGSLIVARGHSIAMVLGGQLLTSLSTGTQALLYAVSSEILPRQYRPLAQGGLNVSLSLGAIVTLLAGSDLIRKYADGFRIMWYLMAGVFGASGVVCAIAYKPPKRPLQVSLRFVQKVKQLDWIGYGLFVAGIVLFNIALTWSDNPFSWKDSHILAPFILGILLIIGFIVYEKTGRKDGMFHHDLFAKDRNFAIAIGLIFVEGMAFYAANVYFPYEDSVLFESDPVKSGLRFSIVFFTAVVSSSAVALYSWRAKRLRLPLVLAFLLFVIFFALMSTITVSRSTALWGYPVLSGTGLGICLTLVVTAAQLSAPPELIAITSGLVICMRALGGSVGLPIYAAIFNSQARNLSSDIAAAVLPLGLSPDALPGFIAALIAHDEHALHSTTGQTIIMAVVDALKACYLQGFRYINITAAVISAVACLAAFFLIDPKDSFSMDVDAPLEVGLPSPKQSRSA